MGSDNTHVQHEPFFHGADADDEYWFREGCHILELLNDPRDPALSIARARVEPGVTTRWHRLRETTERYLIQTGRGEVWVGNEAPRAVAPGDVVVIPAGVPQRITNTGSHELVFFAMCTPRFLPEHYEDLE